MPAGALAARARELLLPGHTRTLGDPGLTPAPVSAVLGSCWRCGWSCPGPGLWVTRATTTVSAWRLHVPRRPLLETNVPGGHRAAFGNEHCCRAKGKPGTQTDEHPGAAELTRCIWPGGRWPGQRRGWEGSNGAGEAEIQEVSQLAMKTEKVLITFF